MRSSANHQSSGTAPLTYATAVATNSGVVIDQSSTGHNGASTTGTTSGGANATNIAAGNAPNLEPGAAGGGGGSAATTAPQATLSHHQLDYSSSGQQNTSVVLARLFGVLVRHVTDLLAVAYDYQRMGPSLHRLLYVTREDAIEFHVNSYMLIFCRRWGFENLVVFFSRQQLNVFWNRRSIGWKAYWIRSSRNWNSVRHWLALGFLCSTIRTNWCAWPNRHR